MQDRTVGTEKQGIFESDKEPISTTIRTANVYLSIECGPVAALSRYKPSPEILPPVAGSRWCCCHFIGEDTEAPRNELAQG